VQLSVFLRHPLQHVYSQFLECKYDGWGRKVTRNTTFPHGDLAKPADGLREWIAHFLAQPQKRKASFVNDFRCYNPWNMQARYMATKFAHNANMANLEPSLKVAKENTKHVLFVGIQDLYGESLCLFRFYATGMMPSSCACGGAGAIRSKKLTRIRHGVPPHPLSDLSRGLVQNIAKVARVDAQLFRWSLDLFERRLREAQADSGVQVVCEHRLADLRRAADEFVKMTLVAAR